MSSKTWTYKRSRFELKISYEGDHFLYGAIDKEGRPLSFEDLFLSEYPLATLAIEMELIQLILAEHDCPIDFSEAAKWRWQFWQHLNTNAIEPFSYDLNERKKIIFNQYGIYLSVNINSRPEPITSDKQRLDQLFFEGPQTPSLPLDIRRKMITTIWQALQKEHLDFDLTAAFPLFDYNQLEDAKWTKSSGQSGTYIHLNKKGSFTRGGWDSPRSGGQNDVSLESVWAYPDKKIPSEFHDKKSIILNALKATIQAS